MVRAAATPLHLDPAGDSHTQTMICVQGLESPTWLTCNTVSAVVDEPWVFWYLRQEQAFGTLIEKTDLALSSSSVAISQISVL
jgi:hypothetical protein